MASLPRKNLYAQSVLAFFNIASKRKDAKAQRNKDEQHD